MNVNVMNCKKQIRGGKLKSLIFYILYGLA